MIECLDNLPSHIQAVLDQNDAIREAAIRVRDEKSMLIMGRGYSYANCLEGALKIKELTYLHCEAILAGELKHGPLALIEESLSIIMVRFSSSRLMPVYASLCLPLTCAILTRCLLAAPDEGQDPGRH